MNKKILIVDDEPKNLKILRLRLEKEYDLEEAEGGSEALEKFIQFKPALVLLDVMMPDIDGYGVCEKIKGHPELNSTKVVLLTGKGTIEDKLEGYKRGADDYMVKPFNGEELKAKVKVFLSLYNLENDLVEKSHELSNEVEHKNEKLIEAEKLAYLGINTAEIVHNLKNPLSIIKMLATRYKKGKIPEDFADKLISNVDKTFDIIKTVMNSSRETTGEEELETFDLNKLTESELDFIKFNSNFKYNIELETDFSAQGLVFGNRGHYQQVIGNILKNGAEALEEVEKRKICIKTYDEGSTFILKICDTGPGISPENLEKIFDSNFSTKVNSDDPLSGTGIGLAYCKKIIESYGGTIRVDSEVGKGTTFTLTF